MDFGLLDFFCVAVLADSPASFAKVLLLLDVLEASL